MERFFMSKAIVINFPAEGTKYVYFFIAVISLIGLVLSLFVKRVRIEKID